ncbi:MAG TPA: hypothetical protein VMW43_11440 [Bacteroidota bacterium]|nr:hypothetical protein [Bacteroidota bacterium]
MQMYDLALAWNWEFDREFIFSIERECARRGVSTYRIDTGHLAETLARLAAGGLKFLSFFDRASDADPAFLPLSQWMEEHVVYYINPRHRVVHAVDKATMHLEFLSNGLHVPDTIILPPFHEQPEHRIDEKRLHRLGVPFVIKPANTTGGGTGVKLSAHTVSDIAEARREHKNDKYLIQELITPADLKGNRAWFRVYYAFGEIIPCWWNDQTHRYSILTEAQEKKYGLKMLRNAVTTVQSIALLDFFSSEIALTEDKEFVLVDYVNEVCDMRLQSRYHDGAPDAIVHRIERLIAMRVARRLSRVSRKTE